MEKKQKNTLVKRLALTLPLLMVSFLFVFTAQASGIAPADVITLTNSAREKEGLKPVVYNAKLAAAAKDKADDMLKNDYFSHTSPQGLDPWYWMKQAGYSYKYAGENLAINYSNAQDQHIAWMKSTTHRANILNVHYQEIGVATVAGKINGKDSIVTVELFGSPVHVVANKNLTAVPPVAVEAVIPFVKGVETSNLSVATFHIAPRVATMIQATAFISLLFVAFLTPLAFFQKAVLSLIQMKQMKRENGTGKGVMFDTVDHLPPLTLDTLHQSMKQNTPLVHDIRAG